MDTTKLTVFGIIGALLLFLIISTNTIIKPGERGVKVTLGKVSPVSLKEGIYFKIPFVQQIIPMSIKTQAPKISTTVYTKDIQNANVTYILNYNLSPDTANKMYSEVGLGYKEAIVIPVAQGVLKDVAGKWNASELISNREKATSEILVNLQKELVKKDITVTGLQITDIKYDSNFEKSIEAKVIAQQNAFTAKNKTVQVQEEANQRVIAAEADAKAMKIKADALKANAKLVDFEMIKVRMKQAEKWDGKLPQFISGGASMNMMDLSKLMNN